MRFHRSLQALVPPSQTPARSSAPQGPRLASRMSGPHAKDATQSEPRAGRAITAFPRLSRMGWALRRPEIARRWLAERGWAAAKEAGLTRRNDPAEERRTGAAGGPPAERRPARLERSWLRAPSTPSRRSLVQRDWAGPEQRSCHPKSVGASRFAIAQRGVLRTLPPRDLDAVPQGQS